MSGFLDFSPVTISKGGGSPLPLGVFPGRVKSAQSVMSSKGTPQFEFKVEVTEPAYAGAVRTEWINTDPSDKTDAEKVKKHLHIWGTAFVSIGVQPENLAGLKVPHAEICGIFADSDCFIEVSERQKIDGTMTQRIRFLKPATYAIKRGAQDAIGGPEAAATTPTLVAPPSALAAMTTTPSPAAATAAPVTNGVSAPAAAPPSKSAGLMALLAR